jgi:beta-lactam-binding protein with PASTA domain
MEFFKKLKLFFWSKHFLKHFGLIILFYLLVISITIFYLDAYTNHGQKIKVPNYIGKTLNSVKGDIESLGLQYEVLDSIYKPELPIGTILEQDPEPTDLSQLYVKDGRIIRFRVSKNKDFKQLPNLINYMESFAVDVLKNRSFKYVVQYKQTTQEDGAVLDQLFNGKSVRGGEWLPIGSTIVLIVGENNTPEPVELPNLYGLTISEAQQRISAIGDFELITICSDCITSEDSLMARISMQQPEYLEGVKIAVGTPIKIFVSKDFVPQPIEVPEPEESQPIIQ